MPFSALTIVVLPLLWMRRNVRGGPHFNGHNNGTFSHIMVVDGYNNTNDRVVFADPGARVLWAGAQEKFEYPSLNAFITTYCQSEIMGDGRQHIGMFAPL